MKLKILYAVLLLGAISQLNGSYYWNRINPFNRYHSKCAKYLCLQSNRELYNNCLDKILNRRGLQLGEIKYYHLFDKYLIRDCNSIGGTLIRFGGCVPRNAFNPQGQYVANSGYFNRFVCGYN